MDDVLHRLNGVPEANFSSMVQEVSAYPGLAEFPHLPGNSQVRGLNFPLLCGYPVESKIWIKLGLTHHMAPWAGISQCQFLSAQRLVGEAGLDLRSKS